MPTKLTSTEIDLGDDNDREIIIQGSGFGINAIDLTNLGDLQSEFSNFVTAIQALNGSATGKFSSLTLKQNGVTIASISISPTTLTLTSGADTLTFVGNFPTSLSQIDTAFGQLFNSKTNSINDNFDAATSILSSFDLKSATATVNGVTEARFTFTGSAFEFTAGGYSFDITGVLPSNFGQLVQIGIDFQKAIASNQTTGVTTGYSLNTASIIDDSTGQVIGEINFNHLDIGALATESLPADVKISFTDSASDFAANIDAYELASSRIGAITLSDPTDPIVITAQQYADDSTVLKKIAGAHIVEVESDTATVTVYTYNSSGALTSTQTAALPTISGASSGQATELEGTVTPFSNVVISDPNSGATDTLTITLSGAGGILSGNGLVSKGNGVYQLSGDDALVTSELEALEFTPNAVWPKSLGITTFTLSDVSSAVSSIAAVNSATTVIDNEPTGAISISATYLAANIGAINGDSSVTSITLNDGGTPTLTLTAKQATLDSAALAKIQGAYTLVVADNAADLLAAAYKKVVASASDVVLTGENVVTAAQATALAGLPNFTIGGGASLSIADKAGNLLSASNAKGIAVASEVELTGANVVDVAQAAELADMTGLTPAKGAKLAIEDSAASLLGADPDVLALATSVVLTGANTETVANAALLEAIAGFQRAATATLIIADTASDLLAANAATLKTATKIEVTGTSNDIDAAQAETLAKLNHIVVSAGATLVISDTAVNLLAATDAAGVKLATSLVLTGANVVTGAKADQLMALKDLTLGSGSLVIEDTAAGLEKLTAEAIARLPSFGVTEIVDAAGNVSFSAAQTKALQTAGIFLTATGAATARENFADGGYDTLTFGSGGSLTSETLYKNAHSVLADWGSTSGLSLDASSLTVSETSAGLSVSHGADVSWITPLTSASDEAISAGTTDSETFSFGSGFGATTIADFVAGSSVGHDVIALSASAFGITDIGSFLTGLLSQTGSSVTIKDQANDSSIVLTGVEASNLVAADFKLTT